MAGRGVLLRRLLCWLLAALLPWSLPWLLTGCATLPPGPLGAPSAALPASAQTPLGRLAASASPDPDLSGFRLMPDGAFALDTRLQLIRQARQSLDLQYYQIDNDETGRYLLRALRDAAQRGVRVRLLMDDLYTVGADELLLGLAAHPQVELRLFNPFPAGRQRLSTRVLASLLDADRINRRMHNKLFIADGAMAVAGGRNIGSEYFGRKDGANFIDLDTFAVGAIVPRLQQLFDRYWNSAHVRPVQAVAHSALDTAGLQARFDQLTAADTTPAPPPPPPNDVLGFGPLADDLAAGRLNLVWAPARAHADSPERVVGKTADYGGVPLQDVDSVRYNVAELIRRAQAELVLASPYLVPGAAGLDNLRELRAKGAQVSLVTNALAATDEPVVHTGYRRYRPALLRLGVQISELSPVRARQSLRLGVFNRSMGRLHAKTAVADRRLLYLGSMNFDPRSQVHNTEIGLFIDSPALAGQVLKLLDVLQQQGAYQLRLGANGQLQWWSGAGDGDRDGDRGAALVWLTEPDASWLDRLLLELIAPLVPESLL